MPSSSSPDSPLWVAISGGVDSAVAAALLQDQGETLVGATMRLAAPGLSAQHDAAITSAIEVCAALGVEHVVIDLTREFSGIVGAAHRTRHSGTTPNPCVLCNETLKFGVFMDAGRAAGAAALATGHYVRKLPGPDGRSCLARGVDSTKDQSYFLYRLAPSVLDSCVFPLGSRTKQWVAAEAERRGLPVLQSESQDLCVPEAFDVEIDARPGRFVDESGAELGLHDGIAGFTVGQRKGLGLGGGDVLYVLAIDPESRDVTVGSRSALDRRYVRATDPVWYAGDQRPCDAAVRYGSAPKPAIAHYDGTSLTVEFDSPIDAPAPGQSVVCYEGDVVVGGGIIASAW